MKKFVCGLLIGFLLAIPTYALAEQESMIGKTVGAEYPVIIDGKVLEVPAIVVDGRSFAPVRAIGEAMGLNVSFENQTVILTNQTPQEAEKGEGEGTVPEPPQTTQEVPEFGYTLDNIDHAIESQESIIRAVKAMINMQYEKENGPDQELLDALYQDLSEQEELLEQLKTFKQKLIEEANGTP